MNPESVIEKYQRYLDSGKTSPVPIPQFFTSEDFYSLPGGERVEDAIEILQADSGGALRGGLYEVLIEEDHVFWREWKTNEKQTSAANESKLRLMLLHHKLFKETNSKVWSRRAFNNFINRHFTPQHCEGDSSAFEMVVTELLQDEADRIRTKRNQFLGEGI